MEQTAIVKLRAWVRKPASIIGVVMALFIIINGVYFGLQLWPGHRDYQTAQEELSSARARLTQIASQPDPKKVTREEIQSALEQVPTFNYAADVVLQLINFAMQANVKLASFKMIADKDVEKEVIIETIDSLEGGGSGAEGNETSVTVRTSSSSSIIQENKYEITAIGSLHAVFNYFELLASNQSITDIRSWSLGEAEESESADDDLDQESLDTRYALRFEFSLYSVPSYEKEFGTGMRQDTSIENVMRELQQRFPELIDFESILPNKEETQ